MAVRSASSDSSRRPPNRPRDRAEASPAAVDGVRLDSNRYFRKAGYDQTTYTPHRVGKLSPTTTC